MPFLKRLNPFTIEKRAARKICKATKLRKRADGLEAKAKALQFRADLKAKRKSGIAVPQRQTGAVFDDSAIRALEEMGGKRTVPEAILVEEPAAGKPVVSKISNALSSLSGKENILLQQLRAPEKRQKIITALSRKGIPNAEKVASFIETALEGGRTIPQIIRALEATQ